MYTHQVIHVFVLTTPVTSTQIKPRPCVLGLLVHDRLTRFLVRRDVAAIPSALADDGDFEELLVSRFELVIVGVLHVDGVAE